MNAPNANIKRRLTILLLLGAAPLRAGEARLRLETTVDPSTATVGDRLRLTVRAVAEGDVQISSPSVGGALGIFEVAGWEVEEAPGPGASPGRVFRYTLVPFDVGVATIPALSVPYRFGGGPVQYQPTPEIFVQVRSVLPPDAGDIRGLKGRLPRVPNEWFWGLLAVGTVLAFLVYFLRTRRRPGTDLPPGPPPRPAHLVALEALDRLEKDLAGPAKPFYSRLTDIWRVYLEARFGLPALDRTSGEIAQSLRNLPVSSEQKRRLREWLDVSDLAKFAKTEPGNEARLAHLDLVRSFVDSTVPAPTDGRVS